VARVEPISVVGERLSCTYDDFHLHPHAPTPTWAGRPFGRSRLRLPGGKAMAV